LKLVQSVTYAFRSDTGVLLNNELDDFTAKPGAANAFGLACDYLTFCYL